MKVKDLLEIKDNVLIMKSDNTKCVYDGKSIEVKEQLELEVKRYYEFDKKHLRIVLQ